MSDIPIHRVVRGRQHGRHEPSLRVSRGELLVSPPTTGGMEPDLSPLDSHLSALGVDAYLIDADSTDSNQRYLSGFDAPDPFVTCYTPDELSVLVSGLEYGRAKKESRADRVDRPVAYDKRKLVDAYGPREASHRVTAAFLSAGGVDVGVRRVPAADHLLQHLRGAGRVTGAPRIPGRGPQEDPTGRQRRCARNPGCEHLSGIHNRHSIGR